jgi:hypothetical protein
MDPVRVIDQDEWRAFIAARVSWLEDQAALARQVEAAYIARREAGQWSPQAQRMLDGISDNRAYFEGELRRARCSLQSGN